MENQMGLPNSQQRILAAIENELQADPDLTAAYSAFAGVPRSAGMPAAGQLRTRDSLTGWRRSGRTGLPPFLSGMIAASAAVLLIGLAAVLAAVVSQGGQNGCGPASTGASYPAICVPGLGTASSASSPLPHKRHT
jgi:hypothetical protein